jgi:hypothetical protein
MILSVPLEIQQIIYDKCEIKERALLNVALPKQYRKTNVLDKNLRIIHEYMKRRHEKKRISHKMLKFVTTHQYDPTIQSFCNKYEIPLVSSETKPDKINKLSKFILDIVNKVPLNPELYPEEEEMTYDDKTELRKILQDYGTPSIFEELQKHSKTKVIIDNIISLHFDTILFHYVNNSNEEMVKYLMENETIYPFCRLKANYYVTAMAGCFVTRSKCREILLKYFTLEHQHYEKMLDEIFDNMHTDVINDVIRIIPYPCVGL